MKKSGRWFLAAAVCAVCVMGSAYHVLADEDTEITMKGVAIWSGKRANVTAVLTPTNKKNNYTVVYTFKWGGRDMEYVGKMKRNLKKGTIIGSGAPQNKARTFVYKLKLVKKRFIGKHYETTSGKTKLTGDMYLKVVKTP